MLEEIERHDCDVYLILISNGIQMKSLLKYGDKYLKYFVELAVLLQKNTFLKI